MTIDIRIDETDHVMHGVRHGILAFQIDPLGEMHQLILQTNGTIFK